MVQALIRSVRSEKELKDHYLHLIDDDELCPFGCAVKYDNVEVVKYFKEKLDHTGDHEVAISTWKKVANTPNQ